MLSQAGQKPDVTWEKAAGISHPLQRMGMGLRAAPGRASRDPCSSACCSKTFAGESLSHWTQTQSVLLNLGLMILE